MKKKPDLVWVVSGILINVFIILVTLIPGIISHTSGWLLAGILALELVLVNLVWGVMWAILSPIGEEAKRYEEEHPLKPLPPDKFPPSDFERVTRHFGNGIILLIEISATVIGWFAFGIIARALAWPQWIGWSLTGLFFVGMIMLTIFIRRKIRSAKMKQRQAEQQKLNHTIDSNLNE